MKINLMEKPNPDNYNSTGFYLDDLEKYNQYMLNKIYNHYCKNEVKERLVWDYSDIAIKFKHWIPEKEFENENAAFTFFFEEVYNRTEKKI